MVRKKTHTHKCQVCGVEFISLSHNSKYCSNTCMYIAKGERKRQQKINICQYCGKKFTPIKGRWRFCSNDCYNARHREKQLDYYYRNKAKESAEQVKEQKAKKKSSKPTLQDINNLALSEHKSYGEYVAKQSAIKVDLPPWVRPTGRG